MANFFFFENDRQCDWMQREFQDEAPKYLQGVSLVDGTATKYHLILKWIMGAARPASPNVLDEMGFNYVRTVDDLPRGEGIYVTAYDADVRELERAKSKGIPIIEHPCPWVRQLRAQLMDVDQKMHQVVLMIDREHVVYECFQSIIPADAIIVQPDSFEGEIAARRNGKPIRFLSYATFRKVEAERVVSYIEQYFPDPENKLDGYKKTLCLWTRQGLLDEIRREVPRRGLGQVWVICNSEWDRSTKSILGEIQEAGARSLIIKRIEDVPEVVEVESVGVLLAPIPVASRVIAIKDLIRRRFAK